MRRVVIAVTVVLATCGLAFGQPSASSNYEQLKCHEPLIGDWVYDGPVLDEVPGFAEKGSKVVFRISWQWILDKNAIDVTWSMELEGKPTISGKGLIAWDKAASRIVGGGVDSGGGYGLDTTTYDEATKTFTTKSQGVDGEARSVTSTSVLKIVDADTITVPGDRTSGGRLDRRRFRTHPQAQREGFASDPEARSQGAGGRQGRERLRQIEIRSRIAETAHDAACCGG